MLVIVFYFQLLAIGVFFFCLARVISRQPLLPPCFCHFMAPHGSSRQPSPFPHFCGFMSANGSLFSPPISAIFLHPTAAHGSPSPSRFLPFLVS